MKFPRVINESWHKHLEPLFNDPRWFHTEQMIRTEVGPTMICPAMPDIFKVFRMPFSSIEVVILGLSPYASTVKIGEEYVRHATGLAMGMPGSNFEVYDTPTLYSIRDALALWYGNIALDDEFDQTLEKWEAQGVFLLNRALTVKAKSHVYEKTSPKAHFKYWDWFTSEIIRIIDRHHKQVPFVFFGNDAYQFHEFIESGDNPIIRSCHPVAAVYAAKEKAPYQNKEDKKYWYLDKVPIGSNFFRYQSLPQVDQWRDTWKLKPIEWI